MRIYYCGEQKFGVNEPIKENKLKTCLPINQRRPNPSKTFRCEISNVKTNEITLQARKKNISNDTDKIATN